MPRPSEPGTLLGDNIKSKKSVADAQRAKNDPKPPDLVGKSSEAMTAGLAAMLKQRKKSGTFTGLPKIKGGLTNPNPPKTLLGGGY